MSPKLAAAVLVIVALFVGLRYAEKRYAPPPPPAPAPSLPGDLQAPAPSQTSPMPSPTMPGGEPLPPQTQTPTPTPVPPSFGLTPRQQLDQLLERVNTRNVVPTREQLVSECRLQPQGKVQISMMPVRITPSTAPITGSTPRSHSGRGGMILDAICQAKPDVCGKDADCRSQVGGVLFMRSAVKKQPQMAWCLSWAEYDLRDGSPSAAERQAVCDGLRDSYANGDASPFCQALSSIAKLHVPLGECMDEFRWLKGEAACAKGPEREECLSQSANYQAYREDRADLCGDDMDGDYCRAAFQDPMVCSKTLIGAPRAGDQVGVPDTSYPECDLWARDEWMKRYMRILDDSATTIDDLNRAETILTQLPPDAAAAYRKKLAAAKGDAQKAYKDAEALRAKANAGKLPGQNPNAPVPK